MRIEIEDKIRLDETLSMPITIKIQSDEHQTCLLMTLMSDCLMANEKEHLKSRHERI